MEKESITNFSITRLSRPRPESNIAMQYDVGCAQVIITDDAEYYVIPPEMSKNAETVFQRLMGNIFESLSETSTDHIIFRISEHLETEAKKSTDFAVWEKEKSIIEYYLKQELVGFQLIDVPMNDPYLEDIICTRYDKAIGVIHKKFHDKIMLKTNITFGTSEKLDGFIQTISSRLGKPPSSARSIVYCATPQNHRITFTWKDKISPMGSSFAIRKFPKEPYVITHLLKDGVLSVELAAYLWMLIDANPFLLVIGETGSGKTTMINALMCLSNPRWHVIVIEDIRELDIPNYWTEYSVTYEDPHSKMESNFDIHMMDLVKMALRKKPHFMIVGEVRGEEAREMFQGATTGHGTITSFHASGPSEALTRLRSKPINITENQLMNLWGILHITKLKTRKGKFARRAMSFSEVYVEENNSRNTDNVGNNFSSNIKFQQVFVYDEEKDSIFPKKIEEIIKNSKNVYRASRLIGVEDIVTELQKRKHLLEQCVKEDAYTVKQVLAITSKCYNVTNPDN